MDNFLEILLPLIFFAIYFASQFFGKKDEEGPPAEEEPDSMRKIREELRRKIEERRKDGQQGQQQQRETEPPSEERAGGAVLRESRHRPERETQRNLRPSEGETRKARTETPPPPQPSYDQDLEEQMAEVRRSQEQVEAARRQARERIGSLAATQSASSKPRANRTASYREFLRESLRDPENLRKSFLLHEVFGTPVGMREEGNMRPSWHL